MPLGTNLGHESCVLQSLLHSSPEAANLRSVAHQYDAGIKTCAADELMKSARHVRSNTQGLANLTTPVAMAPCVHARQSQSFKTAMKSM